MSYLAIAEESIKQHEGFRSFPYRCSANKLTIGYGRNIEDRGITLEEAEHLLFNDIKDAEEFLQNYEFWHDLNDVRKAVLLDMVFNLGVARFKKFKKMIRYLSARDYVNAAREMKDSAWYRQVKSRAVTLCRRMKTGQL